MKKKQATEEGNATSRSGRTCKVPNRYGGAAEPKIRNKQKDNPVQHGSPKRRNRTSTTPTSVVTTRPQPKCLRAPNPTRTTYLKELSKQIAKERLTMVELHQQKQICYETQQMFLKQLAQMAATRQAELDLFVTQTSDRLRALERAKNNVEGDHRPKADRAEEEDDEDGPALLVDESEDDLPPEQPTSTPVCSPPTQVVNPPLSPWRQQRKAEDSLARSSYPAPLSVLDAHFKQKELEDPASVGASAHQRSPHLPGLAVTHTGIRYDPSSDDRNPRSPSTQPFLCYDERSIKLLPNQQSAQSQRFSPCPWDKMLFNTMG